MNQDDQTLRMECLRLAASIFPTVTPYDLAENAMMLLRFIRGAESTAELEGTVEIAKPGSMSCGRCNDAIPIDNTLPVALAELGLDTTLRHLVEVFGCKVYVELGSRGDRLAVHDFETGDVLVLTRPGSAP
jgi:hypothetical protein